MQSNVQPKPSAGSSTTRTHRRQQAKGAEEDAFTGNEQVADPVHSGQTMPFPQTLKEALRRSDQADWKAAADLEIEGHLANGTWEPCTLPPGHTVVDCKWVLTEKYNADGSLERKKASLAAKEYSQRPDFDYLETFAPTV